MTAPGKLSRWDRDKMRVSGVLGLAFHVVEQLPFGVVAAIAGAIERQPFGVQLWDAWSRLSNVERQEVLALVAEIEARKGGGEP